jgi:tRNA-specific 2-thiouridylase
MRRALALALAESRLPRRVYPSARGSHLKAWRAPPCWSAPRRPLSSPAEEFDALIASRLLAAVGEPDIVTRVLPHLPRPFVSRVEDDGRDERPYARDGRSSPSSFGTLRPTRVAVGLSGGVDSAVTAWLLKTAGFDVTGVLMRNWDEAEDTGGECEFEKDRRDARAVAARLRIRLDEVDFVREYWHDVFEPFLKDFERGNKTPNPDLACNRRIKFGSLLRHCETALGADVLATGHYARIGSVRGDESVVSLLRGVDPTKDQSYFLASVRGDALRRACFPLGGLTKKEVKALAAGPADLPAAVTARRSSAGICFIGRKKKFGDFVAEYGVAEEREETTTKQASGESPDGAFAKAADDAETRATSGTGARRMEARDEKEKEKVSETKGTSFVSGTFVSVDDWSVVGNHEGLARYTVGQRARLGGASVPWFVVGKDASAANAVAFVAPGRDHPALFATEAVVGKCFWVRGEPPRTVRGEAKAKGTPFLAQTRYGGERAPCDVRVVPLGETPGIVPTRFGPSPTARRPSQASGDVVEVFFHAPTRALTPGQALVLYDGDECLGGGAVMFPGRSTHERAAASRTLQSSGERGGAVF